MKTGFKDPIAPKEGKNKRTPWNFDCPPYDERSSCFVNAGTNYSVGHRQPVGHSDKVKQRVDVLPYGRREIMQDDRVYHEKPGIIEFDEKE